MFRQPDPELSVELDPGLGIELRRAKQDLKNAQAAYKAAEQAVKVAMLDATTATVNGEKWATWTRVITRRLNTKAIREALPEICDEYTDDQVTDRFTTVMPKGARK